MNIISYYLGNLKIPFRDIHRKTWKDMCMSEFLENDNRTHFYFRMLLRPLVTGVDLAIQDVCLNESLRIEASCQHI